ncbi:Putative protein [Zobellia galactanivorans]|uniref:Uncharacterized protein n=1 Tax=Zobellia galactanivorans (strain DSM 12802 / CCUG 47099 / CIP 106680 / NCIMB 13871 / Dsij) TaxID=63186 RepID=G0L285_ZOBGA|nr:Putative protein [Zobellia galactanivorans]
MAKISYKQGFTSTAIASFKNLPLERQGGAKDY